VDFKASTSGGKMLRDLMQDKGEGRENSSLQERLGGQAGGRLVRRWKTAERLLAKQKTKRWKRWAGGRAGE